MTSLSVLWLSREVPWPADAGDKVYTARLTAALASAGANVMAIGLRGGTARKIGDPAPSGSELWRVVEATPRSSVMAALSPRPLVGARYSPAAYVRMVRKELLRRRHDAIVLDQYAMAWVLDRCSDLLSRNRPSIVHVSHNFETEVTAAIARDYRGNLLKKLFLYQNAFKTKRAESALTRNSDLIVVNTEDDAAKFREAGACSEPVVIRPGYAGPRLSERRITEETPRRIVILGSYIWFAKRMNLASFLEAADEVMSEARISVEIIGEVLPDFQAAWRPRLKATVFRGFVPDVSATLASARFGIVAEATGGGFKHKTLDYLYSRVPVAAYEQALGGIPEEIRRHFLVCKDPVSLVRSIVDLIDNIDELNRMQNGAFAAATGEFDWGRNGKILCRAIDEHMEKRRTLYATNPLW